MPYISCKVLKIVTRDGFFEESRDANLPSFPRLSWNDAVGNSVTSEMRSIYERAIRELQSQAEALTKMSETLNKPRLLEYNAYEMEDYIKKLTYDD